MADNLFPCSLEISSKVNKPESVELLLENEHNIFYEKAVKFSMNLPLIIKTSSIIHKLKCVTKDILKIN